MYNLGEEVIYRGLRMKVKAKTYDSECLYDLEDSFGEISTYIPEHAIQKNED